MKATERVQPLATLATLSGRPKFKLPGFRDV
jgi:hypothetical protein